MHLAIDLFCGLGGWTEGLLAEGYDVIGFDVERHRYPRAVPHELDSGVKRPGMNWSDRSKRGADAAMFNRAPKLDAEGGWIEYPAQLVLQDVLTLHGKQFKDAALIVASPPRQEYSYMAMPWSRAKQIMYALRRWPAVTTGHEIVPTPFPDGYTGSRTIAELTASFDACFRIQREAIEAAGHFIPLVVENVRGAQPWVGRSRWAYGSFHLWGDVPALMPMTKAIKNTGGSWFAIQNAKEQKPRNDPRYQNNPVSVPMSRDDGVKNARNCWSDGAGNLSATTGSKSSARKAASAAIAKIPLPLARHIARTWKPIA